MSFATLAVGHPQRTEALMRRDPPHTSRFSVFGYAIEGA